MNKKNWLFIAIVCALAAVYVVYFTDWFRAKTIQISSASRPLRSSRTGSATERLLFALNDYYSLTEVKVVPLAALQTNKLARPVWHLVSDEGSDDVNGFSYGENIQGMDPALAGVQPEPLQPGVVYRLFVAAGRARGQHDFQLGAPSVKPSASKATPDN